MWLAAALIVDALDGPLARQVGVMQKLPRFSGERLDLIVDYLTYVIVPAYLIYEARLMPAALASVATAAILLSSLFHFIDRDSKTEDGYFVGFPALWNVVALYIFVFGIRQDIAFALVVFFALLTFLPFKWVHPVRVRRFRPLTWAVMVVWAAASCWALTQSFPASIPAQIAIAVSTLYMLGVGVYRTAQIGGDKLHSRK